MLLVTIASAMAGFLWLNVSAVDANNRSSVSARPVGSIQDWVEMSTGMAASNEFLQNSAAKHVRSPLYSYCTRTRTVAATIRGWPEASGPLSRTVLAVSASPGQTDFPWSPGQTVKQPQISIQFRVSYIGGIALVNPALSVRSSGANQSDGPICPLLA